MFRIFAREGHTATEIARRINDSLLDFGTEDRFISLVAGWFDPEKRQVVMVNCGHGPVFLRHENLVDILDAEIIPLGILPSAEIRFDEITLDMKDRCLYIATDGITESVAQKRELGCRGFAALLKKIRPDEAAAQVGQIMKLFRSKQLETHDDATLLVINGMT